MKPIYAPLFEPLTFPNGIQLRNRIAVAPMTHYSSNDDGSTADEEFPYVARRSRDAGLFLTACYAVTDNGKAYPGEPLLTSDRFIEKMALLAGIIREQGAVGIAQLHHGGGVCPPELVPDGDVVSPSAVPTPHRSLITPRGLTPDEVEGIVRAFGESTRRAIDAGFDGVEIHGAYGYLLQQFASPYTNRRRDRWADALSFPLAVLQEVQEVVQRHARGPFLVGYRFTPEEALDPGLTMDDALALVEALAELKTDFVDVLVNDYRSIPRRAARAENLSDTRLSLIRRQLSGRAVLLGGGSIFKAEEGLAALNTGVDVITLGREMIIDPEWIEKIRTGQESTIVTTLWGAKRDDLDLPRRFWDTIWSKPGWFPGVA